MDRLIETLQALNNYLSDSSEDNWLAFQEQLSTYESHRDEFKRDFFSTKLQSRDDLNDEMLAIFKTLTISDVEKTRYSNQRITVYECLLEINEQLTAKNIENNSLKKIIDDLGERNKIRWGRILLWSVCLSLCSLVPFFILGLGTMQQFLTTAAVISGAGLTYSVAIGIYTLYEYSPDDENPNQESYFYRLFRDNFFALLNTLLVSLAWTLLLTAVVATPVVSVLFVVGEFAFVIKEITSLTYIYFDNQIDNNLDSPLPEQQAQARHLADFNERKHAAWVNFAAALCLTVVIAAWCFVPGGLFLAAGCLLAMGVVHLLKHYAIAQNEIRMREVLRNDCNRIEELVQPNQPTVDIHPIVFPASPTNKEKVIPPKKVVDLSSNHDSTVSAVSPIRLGTFFKSDYNNTRGIDPIKPPTPHSK